MHGGHLLELKITRYDLLRSNCVGTFDSSVVLFWKLTQLCLEIINRNDQAMFTMFIFVKNLLK